jgi:phosphonate transport system ATP-binding protein
MNTAITVSPIVELNDISKTFKRVIALEKVSIKVLEGEIVALIGPSGSGKSTLLRHIAGLELSDRNIKSSIYINGKPIQENGVLNRSARSIRSNIGVIFQQFNLISRMSVLSNVLLGLLGKIPRWRGTLGLFNSKEKELALEALDKVGLKELANQRASTLSGGQQQRVAIARSMMQQAKVVLADEPIASLDPKSAKMVMKSLRNLQRKENKTVIVTLHQVEYARKYCKRVIALVDGKIVFDGKTKELTDEVIERLYGTTMREDDDDEEHDENEIIGHEQRDQIRSKKPIPQPEDSLGDELLTGTTG